MAPRAGPCPTLLSATAPRAVFPFSEWGVLSHISAPLRPPPTVLSAWNVHVHLADLENSDSVLNENHSGCFWLQETHTSRTFIFTLQKSAGEWAVRVPELSKHRRDPVLPSSHVASSACSLSLPKWLPQHQGLYSWSGKQESGVQRDFLLICLSLVRQEIFPRTLQQTSSDVC